MKKIIVFYHAYLDGDYKNIIQDQLEKVFLSGLYNECDRIVMCVATPDESRLSWVEKITRNFKKIHLEVIRIDRSQYPSNFRESKITLQKLKESADTEPGYYCYFHTKATTNPGYKISMWRKSNDWGTICAWKTAIQMLNDGYDAVGPNLRYATFLGYFPHFSGTYWWTTDDHIKSLNFEYLTNTDNVYSEEFWIGSNHQANLGSTFECGSDAPYLIETEIDSYIK